MISARALERVVAALEAVLCCGFPTQLLIGSFVVLAGFPAMSPGGELSMPYVMLVTALDSVTLIGLIVVLLRSRGERPAAVLFGSRPRWREAWLGLLLLPIVFAIAVTALLAIRTAMPWLHNLEKNPFENLIRGRRDALMFLAVAILGGGVREEVQRGFILHRFEQHLGGGWIGLVVYSAAFGAGHVVQGWDTAVTLVLLGAFWSLVYLTRRSIISAVVSHAGFNAAQILSYTLVGR